MKRLHVLPALALAFFFNTAATAQFINTAYVGIGYRDASSYLFRPGDSNVAAMLSKLRNDFGITRIIIHSTRQASPKTGCSGSGFEWIGTGYLAGESHSQTRPPAVLGAFLREAHRLGMDVVIGLTFAMTECPTYFASPELARLVAADAAFAVRQIVTAYQPYLASASGAVQFYLPDETEPAVLAYAGAGLGDYFAAQASAVRNVAKATGIGPVVLHLGPALGHVIDAKLAPATVGDLAVNFKARSQTDVIWWQDSVGAARNLPLPNAAGIPSVYDYMLAIRSAYVNKWGAAAADLVGGNVELFNGATAFSDAGLQNHPAHTLRINQQVFAEAAAIGTANPNITTWYAPWHLVGTHDNLGDTFDVGAKSDAPRLGAGYRALIKGQGSYYLDTTGTGYPRVVGYTGCKTQIDGKAPALGSRLFNTDPGAPRVLASWALKCAGDLGIKIDLGKEARIDFIETQVAQNIATSPYVFRIPLQVSYSVSHDGQSWSPIGYSVRPVPALATDVDYTFPTSAP